MKFIALLIIAILVASGSFASAQCPGGNCPTAPRAPRVVTGLVSRAHGAVVRSQVSAVSRLGVRRAGVPILRRFRR
jgi:hypothetical protein